MLGGDGRNVSEEIGELQLSAVQEAMNQMMGNAATSMSTVFQKRVEISPPTTDSLDIPSGKGLENLPADDCIVQVKFRLIVGDLINSSIMQLFRVPFAKQLVSDLMNSTSEESAPAVQEQVIQQQQDIVRETVEESRPKNEDIPVQMNQTERGNDQLVQREEKRQQTASVETKMSNQRSLPIFHQVPLQQLKNQEIYKCFLTFHYKLRLNLDGQQKL